MPTQNFLDGREYSGNFSIELIPDASLAAVPPKVARIGGKVYVENGKITKKDRNFQFFTADGGIFSWGEFYIEAIRDNKGQLIWKNPFRR